MNHHDIDCYPNLGLEYDHKFDNITLEDMGLEIVTTEKEDASKNNTHIISRTEKNYRSNQIEIVNADEVMNLLTTNEWLVTDILPQGELFEIFGASGSYKSFMVLDMAFCIATGIEWHGHSVKQGKVLFVVGEGREGVRKRIKALSKHYGIEKFPDFKLIESPIDLYNENSVKDTATALVGIGNVSFMVLDTLHANNTGDEDSSKDFARIVKNVKQHLINPGISKMTGWVHHTGHTQRARSRGTSSRYAALDTSIMIEGNNKSMFITCTKQKDFEPFEKIAFNMKVVETGFIRDDLSQIMSLIPVKNKLNHTESNKYERPLSDRLQKVLSSLKQSIEVSGKPLPQEIMEKENIREGLGINIETWRPAAYRVLDVSSKDAKKKKEAQKKAFQNSRKQLIDRGEIAFVNGWCFVLDDCSYKDKGGGPG